MKFLPIVILAFFMSSCGKDIDPSPSPELKKPYELSDDVAKQWNALFIDISRFTTGYRPPVTARAAAYINLAAYESLVPGMSDKYNSVAGAHYGLHMPTAEFGKEYAWAVVMNNAYKYTFKYFFATAPSSQQIKIDQTFNRLMDQYSGGIDPLTLSRSLDLGQLVAATINDWSATDSWGNNGHLKVTDPSYVPPAGDDKWQPTKPDFSAAQFPYWGKVRTMANSESDLAVPPPPAFSTDPNSEFYKQAVETYNLTNGCVNNPKSEDAWIAAFWSDDCPTLTFDPAGRWIAVTSEVLAEKKLNLADAVIAYTKVSMGLCDAGIGAWKAKYVYNLLRPVDYISKYMNHPEWRTVMCPDGTGNYFTPAFPGYPSGHATFGGAATQILTDIFGANYQMTDRCHEGRTEFNGSPRSYASFEEMGIENAYSRMPLGVHFRMDSESGLTLGKKIGHKVSEIQFKK